MFEGAVDVTSLVVRPIARVEVERFNACLEEFHWLGRGVTGQVLRYVATVDDEWVAVVGFGSAALSCAPRDRFVGWSRAQQYRRLRYVMNNQRFCVLPAGRRPNLASAVLARALRRLPGDCLVAYGHRIVGVETFTDPARHTGACYAATNFMPLGQTLGYGRRSGSYVHHGNRKMCWFRPLRSDATRLLSADFDHPVLRATTMRGSMIDLDGVDFGSLRSHLDVTLADWRKARGIRHNHAALFTMATAAVLSGARNVTAVGEFVKDLPSEALAKLGARNRDGAYVAPHADTFRRALANVDVDALDAAIGDWLAKHLTPGVFDALAFDGKTVRGAYRDDGTQLHLLSAMVHAEGAVLAQRAVPADTNEITQVRPLLKDLDLDGVVVTADALHTQHDHAEFLVKEKKAHYLFIVKGNQPTLYTEIERSFAGPLPDDTTTHTATNRGHGRQEQRRVTAIAAPAGLFPHAAQIVEIERQVCNLDGTVRSVETVYGITSLTTGQADAKEIGRHARGHWGIENRVHWVRDVTYDEDRHQLRKGSAPHAMATLRNLSISVLRLAGVTNIASALRWVSWRHERALALLGL